MSSPHWRKVHSQNKKIFWRKRLLVPLQLDYYLKKTNY